MATKKTKNTRNVTPVTIPRSYDIYSIEKRVHNLETNGSTPTPTPAGSNIVVFDKVITTNNYGWWKATDENNIDLDPTKYILLNVTYIRTNETEGETSYLSSEWMIDVDYSQYMVRFVTMRDVSTPQNNSQTHKVRVAYMEIPT